MVDVVARPSCVIGSTHTVSPGGSGSPGGVLVGTDLQTPFGSQSVVLILERDLGRQRGGSGWAVTSGERGIGVVGESSVDQRSTRRGIVDAVDVRSSAHLLAVSRTWRSTHTGKDGSLVDDSGSALTVGSTVSDTDGGIVVSRLGTCSGTASYRDRGIDKVVSANEHRAGVFETTNLRPSWSGRQLPSFVLRTRRNERAIGPEPLADIGGGGIGTCRLGTETPEGVASG